MAARTAAPGSDDNASGTTAVIEAARVFADIDFDNTVCFIGFSGEEQGLLGSDAWAQEARNRGDSIIGVLNFDMISYGRQNRDSFEVIGKPSNPDCSWLMDFYIAQADTFSTLKPIRIMDPTAEYSDHASFWQQGYVAFCGIEDDFTPKYHTLGDTIGPLYYVNCGTNNWPMATEAIKAAVASLAKLAGAHPRTGVEEGRPGLARTHPESESRRVGRAPVAISLISSGADLEVYDAAGNLVRVPGLFVVDDPHPSTLVWDGRDNAGARSARASTCSDCRRGRRRDGQGNPHRLTQHLPTTIGAAANLPRRLFTAGQRCALGISSCREWEAARQNDRPAGATRRYRSRRSTISGLPPAASPDWCAAPGLFHCAPTFPSC